MWIAIWVLLAGFVVGVYAWTTAILFQQKKAWKDFAAKTGLSYTPGRMTAPPSINGTVNGRRISFFTNTQETPDIRGQRHMTAIEIGLGAGMPTAAALATPEYATFLAGLRMTESIQPDSKDWKPEYIIRTRNGDALRSYLTSERLKALSNVFAMKNSMALFFFDEIDAVLRLETSDPLRNADRMAKLLKSLTATVDRLAPTPAETQAGAARAALIRQQQAAQEMAAVPGAPAMSAAPAASSAAEPFLAPAPTGAEQGAPSDANAQASDSKEK